MYICVYMYMSYWSHLCVMYACIRICRIGVIYALCMRVYVYVVLELFMRYTRPQKPVNNLCYTYACIHVHVAYIV